MRCVDWNKFFFLEFSLNYCRIAHAVRGLKCFHVHNDWRLTSSHRSCGAWIEILKYCLIDSWLMSHRSCGAWIEIHPQRQSEWTRYRRIAHAVRGLKSATFRADERWEKSHRSCGAWIEIWRHFAAQRAKIVASLMRCVDWNIFVLPTIHPLDSSHRSCGAWIEILSWSSDISYSLVASLTRLQWILIQFSARKLKKRTLKNKV